MSSCRYAIPNPAIWAEDSFFLAEHVWFLWGWSNESQWSSHCWITVKSLAFSGKHFSTCLSADVNWGIIWEINQSLVPNLNTQVKTLWHKLCISAKTLLLTQTTNQAFFLCCKTSCQTVKMRMFFSIFREYLWHIYCQARKNTLARKRQRFSKCYSWGKGLSCYLKPWK